MRPSAFHQAIEDGDLEKVRAGIAELGLEDRTRNGAARTPLLSAVIAGQAEVVTLLLEWGADVSARDKAVGYDSLAWAVEERHDGLVSQLLSRGANPNAVVGSTLQPVLHLAVGQGDPDRVAQLVAAGADPNILDGDGRHPLEFANPATAALLIARGAVLPAPVETTPLPWPAADPASPDFTDPVSVTRSCIIAMANWNEAAVASIERRPRDLGRVIDEGRTIADRFLTDKKRRYRNSSVGTPGPTEVDEALLAVEHPRAGRCEVVTRQSEDSVLGYERRYVLLRKAGQWRVDSVGERLPGETKWRPVYL